jgi:predicted phosphate transport protein (TIGR00153 family)
MERPVAMKPVPRKSGPCRSTHDWTRGPPALYIRAMGLLPTTPKFFELFENQSAAVLEAARALQELAENFHHIEAKAQHIKELETKGDHLTHEVIDRLNRTFITPFDREDIHALATALDDVLDNIEGVASRFALFKVTEITPETRELIHIIEQACVAIHEAVRCLRDRKRVHEYCVEINKLENDADIISRNMTAKLFETAADFRELIKWKELYGRLEATTDDCEDVANIIEGIFVKNN